MSDADGVQILYEGRHIRLVRREDWEYIQRRRATGVVMILAITDDRRVVLVEQFRPPLGCNVIELPAGLAGDLPGWEDENLAEAARRELIEETGYDAARMETIAPAPSSPGLTDEVIAFYRATDLTRVGDGGGDDSENITVHEVPLEGIEDWFDRKRVEGAMIDPKLYMGLYLELMGTHQNRD